MRNLLPIVALVLGLGGCTQHNDPPHLETRAKRWTAHRPVQPPAASPAAPEETLSPEATAPAAEAKDSPVQSLNTGDCELWPRYDFPLVIQIDLPPVPPEITEVTPAITAP